MPSTLAWLLIIAAGLHSWFEPETDMKLMILAAVLALVATAAQADTQAKSAKRQPAPPAQPADRYFDAAHGRNDPASLWLGGDYVGRDPDPAILSQMKRTPYN
jgi:hypothetical protein